ncbi:MAG: hypothetical protein EZS28_051578, partial [Streblomastix strix]
LFISANLCLNLLTSDDRYSFYTLSYLSEVSLISIGTSSMNEELRQRLAEMERKEKERQNLIDEKLRIDRQNEMDIEIRRQRDGTNQNEKESELNLQSQNLVQTPVLSTLGAGKRGAQARVLPRRTDSIDLGGTQFDQIYKERVREIRLKQVDGQESNITSDASGDERNNEKDAENRETESQATQSTFERDEEQKSYSDSQSYISEMKSEIELVTQDEITESSQKKQKHKQKHAEVDIEEIKAKLLENYLPKDTHQAQIQALEYQYKIEQQMRKDAETRETRLAAEKEILLKRIINDETKMKGLDGAAAAVSATLASSDNRFYE